MLLEKTGIITQTLIEEHETVGLATYFAVTSSNPLRLHKSSAYNGHVFRICHKISGSTSSELHVEDISNAVNSVFKEDAELGDVAPLQQRKKMVKAIRSLIVFFDQIGIG